MMIENSSVNNTLVAAGKSIELGVTGSVKVFNISLEAWVIIICSILLILTSLIVILLVMQRKRKEKYDLFMQGSDGKTLESSLMVRLKEIDSLKEDNLGIKKQIEFLNAKSVLAYQKVALRKYDAFKEMGGKLSFSLCLLNGDDNGVLITSMHSNREGCYTYVKEIINGESFVLLAEEEKETLNEAKAHGKTDQN